MYYNRHPFQCLVLVQRVSFLHTCLLLCLCFLSLLLFSSRSTPAFQACAKGGSVEDALNIVKHMWMSVEGKKNGASAIPPRTFHYNCAVEAAARSGEWRAAIAILREMEERGKRVGQGRPDNRWPQWGRRGAGGGGGEKSSPACL